MPTMMKFQISCEYNKYNSSVQLWGISLNIYIIKYTSYDNYQLLLNTENNKIFVIISANQFTLENHNNKLKYQLNQISTFFLQPNESTVYRVTSLIYKQVCAFLTEGACLIYVICDYLSIDMSNTYCDVPLFCFSSSFVPWMYLFLIGLTVFSNEYLHNWVQCVFHLYN